MKLVSEARPIHSLLRDRDLSFQGLGITDITLNNSVSKQLVLLSLYSVDTRGAYGPDFSVSSSCGKYQVTSCLNLFFLVLFCTVLKDTERRHRKEPTCKTQHTRSPEHTFNRTVVGDMHAKATTTSHSTQKK